MKKSELIQLTRIIEHIVAKEIRKQLPTIISETFQNMIKQEVITEKNESSKQPIKENIPELKTSLKELFDEKPDLNINKEPVPSRLKKYTKDPKINAILNETVSDLRQRERFVGAAAFQGGYSSLGQSEQNNPPVPVVSNIHRESSINNSGDLKINERIDNQIPLESIAPGVSALDIVKQIPTNPAVERALTRNYSQVMNLIDKKRGKK